MGRVTEAPDLASGGPSITARRVAAYRLGFARVPAPYGDAAADEMLAADVAAGQEPASDRMREYLRARTGFFDRVVVGAIDRGVRQIVVGAAGYDGRAYRYAKPGVRWFEVDHPATQRDKRDRLARLALDPGQVRFVEADFTRDPIADRLTAAGLNPRQPGLFLLEGVAVYLEPAVLDRVLAEFRQVARAGSRLAISVAVSGAQTETRTRFQNSVARLGEPARSALEASQAPEVLARSGWQVTAGRSRRRRPAHLGRPAHRHRRPPGGPPDQDHDHDHTRPRRPASPGPPNPPEGRSPCRPCSPRYSSRSPSSSTTKPNTASRTAPPTTASRGWVPGRG